MTKSIAHLAPLFLSAALALGAGCTTDSLNTGITTLAIIDGSQCTTDADCPTGFACTTTGTCQATGSDVACPSDCDEAEHDGQEYCDPHGDDSDGTGSGSAGLACTSAADCAPGLECKTEWTGHGNSTQTCEVHGGGGGGGGSSTDGSGHQ